MEILSGMNMYFLNMYFKYYQVNPKTYAKGIKDNTLKLTRWEKTDLVKMSNTQNMKLFLVSHKILHDAERFWNIHSRLWNYNMFREKFGKIKERLYSICKDCITVLGKYCKIRQETN